MVKVGGIVDQAEAAYVRGTIEAAETNRSTVILQIDSLGAYGDQAVRLGGSIRAASVPVIAWVGSLGAKAQGGALYLVYASSLATMAPGAGIGPGRPFDLATRASTEAPADVAANVTALQALAPGAGASPAGVRSIVNQALPAGPARRVGAVAMVSADIPSLLRALDGRTVMVGGSR